MKHRSVSSASVMASSMLTSTMMATAAEHATPMTANLVVRLGVDIDAAMRSADVSVLVHINVGFSEYALVNVNVGVCMDSWSSVVTKSRLLRVPTATAMHGCSARLLRISTRAVHRRTIPWSVTIARVDWPNGPVPGSHHGAHHHSHGHASDEGRHYARLTGLLHINGLHLPSLLAHLLSSLSHSALEEYVHLLDLEPPLTKADLEHDSNLVARSVVAHEASVVIQDVHFAADLMVVGSTSRMAERYNFADLIGAPT
jgi:hypothetical protein